MGSTLLRSKNDDPSQPSLPGHSRSLSLLLDDATTEAANDILCKQCEHVIASAKSAIEPQGKTFRNGFGFSFCVFCYADAPGTTDFGQPTTLHTWFPGYAWSYAHCAQCQFHVGWWFTGESRFVGLIATQIIR